MTHFAKKFNSALALLICLLASACGEYSSLDSQCQSQNCTMDNSAISNDGQPPAAADRPQTLADLDFKGMLNGGKDNGSTVSEFNMETRTLILTLPVSGGAFLGKPGDWRPFPDLVDAMVKISEVAGQTSLEIALPLHILAHGIQGTPTSSLPNGEALTNFSSGNHNFVELELGDWGTRLRLYGSPGQVGIYLELPFNPHMALNYPFVNQNLELLGHLSQFPAKGEAAGALFLSLSLPHHSVQIIKNSL